VAAEEVGEASVEDEAGVAAEVVAQEVVAVATRRRNGSR